MTRNSSEDLLHRMDWLIAVLGTDQEQAARSELGAEFLAWIAENTENG